MKRAIFLALIILGIVTFVYYWFHPLNAGVKIRDQVFYVDLAVTPQEKERGLGGRSHLKPGTGMLFVYDHPEQYPFWMKDMRFPLDFIWISGKTVVDLTSNVPPVNSQPLPIYHPRVPVDKVLEVNAGEIQKWGIKVGDNVSFIN